MPTLTSDPEVLGSSLTGSTRFLRGSVPGQATSEPLLSTNKEIDLHVHLHVNYRSDMTEIMLTSV